MTEKIIQEVKKRGLFYPPDSLINSGGLRGLKYGVTSDYVLGLEVVLPNGEMIRTGGKLAKDVDGYDLTRLFVFQKVRLE